MRLPVYGDTLDDVQGVLLARDALKAEREAATSPVASVMRPAYFVPETKPVEDLIREMRAERLNMAIVIDEFGGTSGLVTLEDLIEEIVGEIHDEHEVALPMFQGSDGRTLIAGQAPIWQVNEKLGLELSEEEHDTIGGFVFGQLGRIPNEGDEVTVDGGRLRVVNMSGRRVARIAFLPGTRS
jgi:CBS domain containing-hemolysin-like protein